MGLGLLQRTRRFPVRTPTRAALKVAISVPVRTGSRAPLRGTYLCLYYRNTNPKPVFILRNITA